MSLVLLPPWLFMWSLAVALFMAAKGLTLRSATGQPFGGMRLVAYCFAWPGMDADAFLRRAVHDTKPGAWEWLVAGGNVALGAVVFWLVASLVGDSLARGWLGMMGLALMLHFGVFHLLSCLWRALGVEARPLMQSPAASQRVSEFWGRRWNTAFRDLTHRFLFRPLSRVVGPRWALALGFLVSGLIHELVISLPAGAGYGGPTAYFCLQGAAILAERSGLGRRLGAGCGWLGRMWTCAVVVLPACVLFHPPFVRAVVIPMMDALGASRGG